MNFISIYSTWPSESLAKKVAAHLVSEKLIACANIIPNVTSVYEWEGKVETSEEIVMIMKTQEAHYEKVESVINEMHEYDTPCILSTAIEKGNAAYLQWLTQQTK